MTPEPRPIDHVLRGDGVALIDRAGTMTFAEVEAAVAGLAGWLAALGLAPGARVASWLPKTREACLLPLAAPRAGLVHVPVNPALRRAQVAHILADSGAAVLLTQEARAATLAAGDVPEGCRMVTAAGEGEPMPPSNADPDALAAILYTSGSTGFAKGVMLSHANLWLGAVSVASFLKLAPDDRVLGVLPLAFDYGQNQLFSTWYAGATVAPLDYLTARDVVKAVERVGATTLAGVPPLWVQLLEAEWPAEVAARLRRLTNSGGALTPRLVRGLRERFPEADLYPMYGLTEAFRSTYLDPALVDAQPDAIGRAIPFAEVMAVRPDGSRAAPGEPGEMVHAGPLVAQGYWRDPERTALRFRPAPAWAEHGGMAVWSGDTVVEGADGLFRFVGRDDEMMKVSGNRVSPGEVEEAIAAGGEVLEAVVVGVADERLGQAIVAVVAGDPAREEALRARLRGALPVFMQPGRYEWREALPRNANGKLDRAAIREGLGRIDIQRNAPATPPPEGEGDQPQAGGGGLPQTVRSRRAPSTTASRRSPSPSGGGVVEGRSGLVGDKPMGSLPPEFAGQSGMLAIGGRSAADWAEAGTPVFVYDAAIVAARVARFRRAFAGVDLHYAIKANPLPHLLAAIAPLVDGLDVASAGELARALAVKAAGAVSFAGPGKRDGELADAISAGATINLESDGEARRALAMAERLGETPRLAVRVNPDVELRGSGMRMGGRPSPFGVDAERAGALARMLIGAGADWLGWHVYAGSQALDARAIADTQAATIALAARLSEEAGAAPPLVNLGGGFGVPYFAGDVALDVEAVGAALAGVPRPDILAESRFAIELGRWLVAEAGVYLTRVVDVKQSQGETFVVVDGGLNHQLAASGNFGTVVRRNYPLAVAHAMGAPAAITASVVGPLCTPLDRLGDRVALPAVAPGDLIAVFLAGAYGASASPADFLGHPPAAERVAALGAS